MIEVDADGFEEEVSRTWTRAVAEVRVGVSRGVGYGARDGAAAARDGHTFVNRSGDLERSIQNVVVGWVNDNLYVANIVARTPYASYVEEGTPPHLIPGNPTLSFDWKGERVHFRYINHPGSRPYPFMHLAYYKAERVLIKEIELGVERAQAILDR